MRRSDWSFGRLLSTPAPGPNAPTFWSKPATAVVRATPRWLQGRLNHLEQKAAFEELGLAMTGRFCCGLKPAPHRRWLCDLPACGLYRPRHHPPSAEVLWQFRHQCKSQPARGIARYATAYWRAWFRPSFAPHSPRQGRGCNPQDEPSSQNATGEGPRGQTW